MEPNDSRLPPSASAAPADAGSGRRGRRAARLTPGGITPRRLPQTRREWGRTVAWLMVGYGITAPVIRLVWEYDSIGLAFTVAAALAAWLWVAPRRYEVRTWFGYVLAIFFFSQLRDAANETALQASTGYVLDWELWMFHGTTPSAWLQTQLGGATGDPGPLAFFSVIMHWMWFVFPHAVVLGAFFFARPMFFRVAAIVAGSYFFAVALYYLVPTVPPWLAVEQGATTGIRRIMEDVGPEVFGQRWWDRMFRLFADPNREAAMPSLHFAAALVLVIVAVFLRAPRLFALAAAYSVALAFSLMYLGEHYFADIIAGGAAAFVSVFMVESTLGNGPGVRFARRVMEKQGGEAWRRPPLRRTLRLPDRSVSRPEPRRGPSCTD